MMPDNPLNAVNRGVYISDNLPFLRRLNDGCIDLVCIDPPFGKKQTFEGKLKPALGREEQRIERELMESWGVFDAATAYEAGLEYPDQTGTTARFRDIWAFERLFDDGWLENLEETFPAAWWLIQATRYSHGEQTAAYIGFMLERLVEIKRVLKDTGSVYLHCDHEANAYLRQLMDVVFGKDNFRNEIVWCYTGPSNTTRWFPRKHDTILFYAKSDQATFNRDAVRVPYRRLNIQHREEGGSGIGGNLTADNVGNYRERGKVPEDYWTEEDGMTPVGRLANERTGYPTQKPQALARRIIEASSNPGDVVVDCFAGCAYVPVAAELTGRRWVACDMSPRAWTVVRRQFQKQPSLRLFAEGEQFFDEPLQIRLIGNHKIKVRGPKDLPKRETPEREPLPQRRLPTTVKYRQKPLETSKQIFDAFVAQYGPECWYCERRMSTHRAELHLDHVEPNKRDGSNDDCWNRALACSPCNLDKGGNPDLERVFKMALDGGRISSDAKVRQIRRNFEERRAWARGRYDDLPKQAPFPTLVT